MHCEGLRIPAASRPQAGRRLGAGRVAAPTLGAVLARLSLACAGRTFTSWPEKRPKQPCGHIAVACYFRVLFRKKNIENIPIDVMTDEDMNREKSNTKARLRKYEEQEYGDDTSSETQPAKAAAKETLEYKTLETFSGALKETETEEPEDDDVTRHITRLREKFGWQTVLPQRCLEYKSSKLAVQKIILKEPLKDDGEFVYCLSRKNRKGVYNPYDLQVVSAHRARHGKEFWIITASSVSKVTNVGGVEEVESVPTVEWLLERTCYHLLQQFRIFSKFR
ncbi:dynein axonemal heavy chain 14-like [Leopardus geoffroyi]|uniref:dynein axonemal heavy chain 14-like n=1 Tax=Leopardus geoffroyi TaxID=46844 RepID=UPI001E260889|nr:dynein axonemal heavy chain 14-like [Leopardus geoffroyi]